MRTPGSTYRVQVNGAFPFSEAAKLVGYLRSLGVETLYCSPVLRARSGSAHCYDVTDHLEVNPELGGAQGLNALSSALKRSGMGLLLDIVPNHMSTSSENSYWMDVLEYGNASPHVGMFDVDWRPPQRSLRGRVLLPVLAGSRREGVASGAIALEVGGRSPFSIRVNGGELPIAPETYGEAISSLQSAALPGSVRTLLSRLVPLLPRSWPGAPGARRSAGEAAKARLLWALSKEPRLRGLVGRGIRVPPRALARVLSGQHYVLARWTEADTRINYRRFLSVNELVALRVEDPAVFGRTHRLIASLLRSGAAMGVRVDHADGLRDPELYFRRLAVATGGSYTLAEKILMAGRRLPKEWDVSGTTGYDFLNSVNLLLVNERNEKRVDEVYRRFTGDSVPYALDVHDGKLLAMEGMRSESGRLARLLEASHAPGADLGGAEEAIRGVAANFGGYRTYISPRTRGVRGRARAMIVGALAKAQEEGAPRKALGAVRDALLLKGRERMGGRERRAALEFVLRFQQFTAAAAVKGEEDTALYRYLRLASLNEVGGDPSDFGGGVAEFHRKCRERARSWPGTMNSTSTHDTKRSEDVRARIGVISEIPEKWGSALAGWHALAGPYRGRAGGGPAPTRRDEYLFYQTLVGAWPGGGGPDSAFVQRIVDYMLKAMREERTETSWARPASAYEEGVERFERGMLRRGSRFVAEFGRFAGEVGWYGALNSLSQTLVKLTAPGVPDIYQGNETVDYSLVDPDNRRPVDFRRRGRALREIDGALSARGRRWAARDAARGVRSGKAKLYVTALALRFRRRNGPLFASGGYFPARGRGAKGKNVVAFVRRRGSSECVTCAPRLFTELCEPGELPCGERSWGETRLSLPRRGAGSYVDVFTGRILRPQRDGDGRSLRAADVFAEFPVALLGATVRDPSA